ncbi:MAG: phosphoribosylamine--glycine ligase [Sphingomicrobium sp.]
MRFLGVSETCDLGALYMRLIAEGHEVQVAVSEPKADGTMRGLVPRADDWRGQLEWIRDAGDDGVILFEAVSEGFGGLQDELRAEGFNVVGGSAFGDRLENDRAFAQKLLSELGFPAGHVWEFDNAAEAAAHVRGRPHRYVVKYSGAGEAQDNFLGCFDDGADVLALLEQEAEERNGHRFILMDFVHGVEVGVGAYFNGSRFLLPACVDWEHKRFFAGDMGELTGEMGTVATFEGTEALFRATLGKIEPLLAGRRHVGYVNLNTIVNQAGIWPLEFTCRFGYPGFAVLEALQRTPWGELLARMLRGTNGSVEVERGFCTGIVVTTPPFPYSRKQVDATVGLPILLIGEWPEADRVHLHYGEVGLCGDQLITAGLYGWTMVVTGTGASVEASSTAAYGRCGRVVVPNGRYRLDIGDHVEGHISKLTALGLFDPRPHSHGH